MIKQGVGSTGGRSRDRVAGWLIVAVFAVGVLILTAGLWIIVTGISNPPAPRTYHERQLDLLDTVVKQKPKSAKAWADYVRAYIAAEQYTQAGRALARGERVVGITTPELALERARLAVAQGNSTDGLKLAIAAYKAASSKREKVLAELAEKAVTVDPRSIAGPYMAASAELKADLYAEKKLWPEAAKAYTEALYETPTSVDYLVKRGAVYLEMKDSKRARADFEAALVYVPGFKPALTGLARIEKESAK